MFTCRLRAVISSAFVIKPRARNYKTSKIELLLDLAGKKKSTLVGRLSAAVTIEIKTKIWNDIAREFNAIIRVGDRSSKYLNKRWQNVLPSAKGKERVNKLSRRKTGGGPPEGVPLKTVELMAISSVPDVQLEGIDGNFFFLTLNTPIATRSEVVEVDDPDNAPVFGDDLSTLPPDSPLPPLIPMQLSPVAVRTPREL